MLHLKVDVIYFLFLAMETFMKGLQQLNAVEGLGYRAWIVSWTRDRGWQYIDVRRWKHIVSHRSKPLRRSR